MDSWAALFESMPRRDAGDLIKAVCAYVRGNEVKIENPLILAMFNYIKEQMEENAITDGK